MTVSDILKQLIKTDSTNTNGELQTAKILDNHCKNAGLETFLDIWDNSRANFTTILEGKTNLPALVFVCHSDVVPAGNSHWKYPPFEAIETDGKIFGRGSCDMKGGIAAIVSAIVDLKNSNTKPNRTIIVAITAGEETDSCGAKRILENRKDLFENIDGLILPEPTNFEIINAHRGIFWLKISTIGKTAHGSMPHMGINAAEIMIKVAHMIKDYSPPKSNNPDLPDPTVSINQFHGGKATNVIPDSCCIELDIRVSDENQRNDIHTDLINIINKANAQIKDCDAKLEIIRSVGSHYTDPQSSFVRTICDITGIVDTKTVGYTTDAPCFISLNKPAIIFGPGKTELAHQPNEYIDIADLEKAVEVYKEIILNYA